jgi:transposase
MRGRKPKLIIELNEPTKTELQSLVRSQKTPAGLARRARAMLLLADGVAFLHTAQQVGLAERHVRKWAKRFQAQGLRGLYDLPRPGRPPVFSPEVAFHLTKIACERPDQYGRSLSQWDCTELALQMVAAGLVVTISAATIRRILHHHKLKPWRFHLWLSPKVARDEVFAQTVRALVELYSRVLGSHELVLCLDEKTSLQPRTRLAPTKPTQPGQITLLEHEYKRAGALNLFAAFDTRSGRVYAATKKRKRQVEFIEFLEQLEAELDPRLTLVHLVMDNVRMHKGKLVQAWLAAHPRYQCHFPPVHCSWMNQVEQWFSILQRKRFTIADFASLEQLAERLEAFVGEWNEKAHPFNWSSSSATKVLAKCERPSELAMAA